MKYQLAKRLLSLQPPSARREPAADFCLRLGHAIENGNRAGDFLLFGDDSANTSFGELLNREIEKLRLYSVSCAAAFQAFLFAFYHALGNRLLDEPDADPEERLLGVHFNSLADTHLIQAFLWLDKKHRVRLYECHLALGLNWGFWRNRLVGAEAVAFAARHFLEKKWIVSFPTPQEDADLKIDLFAEKNEQRLALQIKARSGSFQVECNQWRDSAYLLNFISGVRHYSGRQNQSWSPLLIVIGYKDIRFGHLQESPRLHLGLQRLIQNHI